MHDFLSEEWVDAAREIRGKYADDTPELPVVVRVNLVVGDVPFSDGDVHAHLDTTDGVLDIELDALDDADVTMTTDWEILRGILIGGDPQVLMQAFLDGRIKIQGDMARLLALQATMAQQADNPVAAKVAAELQAITNR